MKISINDNKIFELTETQKLVIKNEIHADEFEADMARRLEWVLMHKYEQCFKKLKTEWDAKLIHNGVESCPTQPDSYAKLVFAQPNYKDRKAKEIEAKAIEASEEI